MWAALIPAAMQMFQSMNQQQQQPQQQGAPFGNQQFSAAPPAPTYGWGNSHLGVGNPAPVTTSSGPSGNVGVPAPTTSAAPQSNWANMWPGVASAAGSMMGGRSAANGGIPIGTPGSWGDLAQHYFGKAGGWIADPLGRLLGAGGDDYKNPADAAQPYLDQIAGTITPYYQPYIDAGKNAMNTLMPQYQNLINNPTAVQNAIGATYHSSPGYGWQVDQATNAANRAAAAGGMMGTPQEQQQLATTVNGLANQDYWNYVNQGLNMYGTGLSGLGNINQMGYGASTGLANNLASALLSQAQLAYAGQANANQSGGGMSFASLF